MWCHLNTHKMRPVWSRNPAFASIGLNTCACVCTCVSRLSLAITIEPVRKFKLLPSCYHDLVILEGATERLVVWVCRICGRARVCVSMCVCMVLNRHCEKSKYATNFALVFVMLITEESLYMKVFCGQEMLVPLFQSPFFLLSSALGSVNYSKISSLFSVLF